MDPQNTREVQSILNDFANAFKPLPSQTTDWGETREAMEARLVRLKQELADEQGALPALNLQARVALESHISNCSCELGYLKLGHTVATGELSTRLLLKDLDKLAECTDEIKSLSREIEECEVDLADQSLWIN